MRSIRSGRAARASALLSILLTFCLPSRADVNPVTGLYTRSWTDLGVPGSATSMRLIRSWMPLAYAKGRVFGQGWCTNWDIEIQDLQSTVPKLAKCGQFIIFQQNHDDSSSQFVSRLNPFEKLVITAAPPGGSKTFEYHSTSEVLTFDGKGILQSWKTANGTRLTMSYNKDGKLTRVGSTAGTHMDLVYQNSLLKSVVAFDRGGKRITNEFADYNYDDVQLTQVQAGKAPPIAYTYDSQNRLTSIAQNGQSVEKLTYQDALIPVVTEYRLPNGCIQRLSYQFAHNEGTSSKTDIKTSCGKRPVAVSSTESWSDSIKNRQAYLRKIVEKTPNVTVTRTYDLLTQLPITIDLNGDVETRHYDSLSRVDEISLHSGKQKLHFDYDRDQPMPHAVSRTDAGQRQTFAIQYNAERQVVGLTTKGEKLEVRYGVSDRISELLYNNQPLINAQYSKSGALVDVRLNNRAPASLSGASSRKLPAESSTKIKPNEEASKFFGLLNAIHAARTRESPI